MDATGQHSDSATDRLIGRMRFGYWTALLVIALMAMVTFVLVDSAISTQRSVSRLVHVAGEQQMLSQRIVLLTNTAKIESSRYRRASSLNHLRDALAAFEQNFAALESKLARDRASEAVRAIMTRAPHDVTFFTRDLITKAEAYLVAAGAGPDAYVQPLPQLSATAALAGYAALGEQVAKEAEVGIANMLRLHRLVFMAMMIVLVLEALLIFRPILGDVSRKTRELTRARNEMAHMARHDQLTGLLNRRSIEAHVQALIDSDPTEHPFALMHIDIDDFKSINDTFGHSVGDAFLIEIARRVTSGLRGKDAVARYGGDEFVVVLDGITNRQNARAVAEHVAALLGKPFNIGEMVVDPKASIGIALCPDDARSFEALMLASDLAMYQAKNDGRGRAMAFDPAMKTDYERRLRMGVKPVASPPLAQSA